MTGRNSGRFVAGKSGNPKGRPRKRAAPEPSALDIMINRPLNLSQNGQARQLTLEEALQFKTYAKALKGDPVAERELLKMITERDAWLEKHSPKPRLRFEVVSEYDSVNANEALLLLGVIAHDLQYHGRTNEPDRFLVEPWAAQAALDRPRHKLTSTNVADIKRSTRVADQLVWPKNIRDPEDD